MSEWHDWIPVIRNAGFLNRAFAEVGERCPRVVVDLGESGIWVLDGVPLTASADKEEGDEIAKVVVRSIQPATALDVPIPAWDKSDMSLPERYYDTSRELEVAFGSASGVGLTFRLTEEKFSADGMRFTCRMQTSANIFDGQPYVRVTARLGGRAFLRGISNRILGGKKEPAKKKDDMPSWFTNRLGSGSPSTPSPPSAGTSGPTSAGKG